MITQRKSAVILWLMGCMLGATSCGAPAAKIRVDNSASRADELTTDNGTVITGTNIYAANVWYDAEDKIYKMWYGGEQEPGAIRDQIYYRTSIDSFNWSPPQSVLSPSDVASATPVQHVNDPHVSKLVNSVTGQFQYTMFFTVCQAPCTENNEINQNEIWSAVSNDGIAWNDTQMLLSDIHSGPAEPAAITNASGAQPQWTVFYVDRLDSQHVKAVDVSGDRRATNSRVVYSLEGLPTPYYQGAPDSPAAMAGVDIIQYGHAWHLMFDAYFACEADTVTVTSNDFNHFSGAPQPLVVNAPSSPIMGTFAPAWLNFNDALQVYASENPRGQDGCTDGQGPVNNHEIHRWQVIDSASSP